MSHTPSYDAAVAKILAELKPGERVCTLTGEKWIVTDEEISWYKKFNVPPSKICPDIRINIMNGFNTGLAIFWKKDTDGHSIISAVHPDSPINIMKDADWFVTNMDSFARVPTNDKSVMEQMWEMMISVPINATRNDGDSSNSIVVGSTKAVDCYLVNANLSRRCFYGYAVVNCEDCIDVVNTTGAVRSYHLSGCQQIADSAFLFECLSCHDCTFLFDCVDCESCFGAMNQRHKKYLWFGEQLNEEDWKKRKAEVNLSDEVQLKKWLNIFYALWREKGVWPEVFSNGNTETQGERMNECVRCKNCYWQGKSTDCYYSRFGLENTQCVFCSGHGWENSVYSSTGGMSGNNNKFCLSCAKASGCEYCVFCIDCENCFGCFGMKRSKFCIFNKQYSESEYWILVDQLKCRMLEEGSYGEFFPAKFSPSGFQFSTGEIYIGYSEADLKKYNALQFDAKRGQLLAPQPSEQIFQPSDLPETLTVLEAKGFVGKPIFDSEVERNFSITAAEFKVYKEKQWPFPRRHFVSRITELVRHANSPISITATCGRCCHQLQTYKNYIFPERVVYCRECYLKYLEENN